MNKEISALSWAVNLTKSPDSFVKEVKKAHEMIFGKKKKK